MIDVVTFGCRLNAYESEVIRRNATQAGLSDAVVVNTCAVTAEAERQARQTIRRLRRERPKSKLIVTGCAAQITPDRYAAMDEVDAVIGNEEKLAPETFAQLGDAPLVGDIMTVSETAGHLIEGFDGRSRAFLQIQNGCDHRCTFCIIPFGRGPSRSVSAVEVIAQANRLYENGYREVVLTGVDIGDYGKDLETPSTIVELVEELLGALPGDMRVRITSIDPVEVSARLIDLYARDDRLQPHWHLSVQSGDDMVLRRMARRHRRADVLRVAKALRAARPDTVIGADFIAGFPTETEAQSANTLALVEEADLALLHVFPYSAREGTAAAKMPAWPKAVRRDRAAALRRAGERQRRATFARFVGRTVDAVIEEPGHARTAHYLPVCVDSEAAPGTWARVALTGHTDDTLIGTLDG
ncbi:MAG: tRNA (N(6)-L-threonylcarbamoyladenosine(37)-C(2))-methylthiotransferase MtaB [Alphaproteobacteria bacterium]